MMDRAASAGFEGIAQMLLEQKKLMDALEAENRELRRQLADLRRGVGIAVVIDGKTIQLATEPASQPSVQSQATLQSLQSLQRVQSPQRGRCVRRRREDSAPAPCGAHFERARPPGQSHLPSCRRPSVFSVVGVRGEECEVGPCHGTRDRRTMPSAQKTGLFSRACAQRPSTNIRLHRVNRYAAVPLRCDCPAS